MYKVMLVDADYSIIQHVNQAVHWSEYDCEVVGTAANGLDALELVHKLAPDIMFVAVRLPTMDGLSLIAAVRNEFPHMQITILSEYTDFFYAQRGIELNISRYLVKPSTQEELEFALKSMVQDVKMFKLINLSTEGEKVTDNFIVQNALHYMEEHYNEQLTLPGVAEHIFVSQWHLSKLISKTKGESFNEILNGIRVNRAKELLEHTSLQIQEISRRVGFNDATHFARVFKKQTGQSANQHRNDAIEEHK